jgi:hypothetical protein
MMTEQTEHTTAQNGAVPARITLEDFIEAVTRGVARAMAAQHDDVRGHILPGGMLPPTFDPNYGRQPSIVVGFVAPTPGPVGQPAPVGDVKNVRG